MTDYKRAWLDSEHNARILEMERDRLRKALDAAMQYVDPKDRVWIETLANEDNGDGE